MGVLFRARPWLALLVALAGAAGCNGSDDDDPAAAGAGAGAPMDGGVDPEDGGPAVACDVVAPTKCTNPPPTFADVEPIFQERCVGCHAGVKDGPWPLTSYTHVATWAGMIQGVMRSCAMPPPDAGIEMPTAEREKILLWIRCGFQM